MPLLHMETEIVRNAGYQLQQVAASIQQESQQLNNFVQHLSGVWLGPSAHIFAGETNPLLQQLVQIADAGHALNQRLQYEVNEWERVSSSFGHNAAAATIGVVAAESAIGAAPGAVPHVVLPTPHWEFKPNDIIGYNLYAEWPGANQKELGNAMSDLMHYLKENNHLVNPPYDLTDDLKQKLEALAVARGISYDETVSEYSKFVQLLNGEVPDLTTRSDYWGDVQQLRFGKVVGDTLGIDPVFGSLLSPTGGLVGPGDSKLSGRMDIGIGVRNANISYGISRDIDLHDSLLGAFGTTLGLGVGTDPLLYHGVYHDAAGYLSRNHNIGPGYEYLLPGMVDSAVDASLGVPAQALLKAYPELNGQETGIIYWILKMRSHTTPSSGGGGGAGW